MTCRFTFELCRNWKSGCINSPGDGTPVLSLSYLTQNLVTHSETEIPMILTPRWILFKENDNENLLHTKQHLLLIHNMCAAVMGIWLNESSFAAELAMNPFWNVSCTSPPGPAASPHDSLRRLCFTESWDGQGPFTLPQVSATLWEMTGPRCSFMMIYLSQ